MPTTQETLQSTQDLLNKVKKEGVTDNAGNYQAFSMDSLNQAMKAAQLPEVSQSDYSQIPGILASGQAMVNTGTQDNGMASLLKQYLGEQTPPPSTADLYSQALQESGKSEAQKQVNDISAQLADINAQAQVANQTLESQASGKDVTTAFLGRQQQEVTRQLAIKSLPLQASLAAAQGNLQMAEDKLNTLYKLKSDDATNKYNYQQKLIDAVYDFATKEEQAKLDAKALEAKNQHDIDMENLNFEHQQSIAKLNASLKPVSSVSGSVDANGNPIVNQAQLGVINDVNTIIDDPALTSTFGLSGILKRNIPGSPEYNLKQLTNNLIDKLSLAARGQLKGQGTVSDFEGKMLKNAQTALKFNMSPDQALQQLINVRGAIATSSGLTATVEVKDLATGQSQILTADQAGINKAIQDGLLVTYK